MQADEGGLSDVNSWMSRGGFSLLAVNADVTEKERVTAILHRTFLFISLVQCEDFIWPQQEKHEANSP